MLVIVIFIAVRKVSILFLNVVFFMIAAAINIVIASEVRVKDVGGTVAVIDTLDSRKLQFWDMSF